MELLKLGAIIPKLRPCRVEVGEPHARPLANIDQSEDVEDLRIAGVGCSTLNGDFLGKAKVAGIAEYDRIELLLDDNPATSMVIGMDERIGQHLAQYIMHLCFVHTLTARIKFERHLHIRSQPVVDTEVEINDIPAPRRIMCRHAILPARAVARLLPIIEKIIGQLIGDRREITETQQTGQHRANNTAIILLCRADLAQELLISELIPSMIGLALREHHPIAPDRILIEIGNRHVLKETVVGGLLALVADHRLHRLAAAMVIALSIPPVGALEHIRSDIHRLHPPIGPRHFRHHKRLVINLQRIDTLVRQHIVTHLVRIIRRVPKISPNLLSIFDALNDPFAILLAHTQHNNAAIRICERTVRRPEITRNAAASALELDHAVFARLDELL